MSDINNKDELTRLGVLHLVEKYGAERVEDTMIFITRSKDGEGALVSIPPTPKRVEAVLEAIYGEYE